MQCRRPQVAHVFERKSSRRLPSPAITISQPTISVGRIVVRAP